MDRTLRPNCPQKLFPVTNILEAVGFPDAQTGWVDSSFFSQPLPFTLLFTHDPVPAPGGRVLLEKLSCQLRWGRVQSCAVIYISAVGQAVRAPRVGEVELYTDEESLLSPVSGGPGPSTAVRFMVKSRSIS